jgi:tRNA-2-methylthio-N6-dimethylallyladenosine synthase
MKVGVLGCMASVWKTNSRRRKIVDLVVGPDAYKDLPNLLAEVEEGRDAINVILSKDETYGDISPVRLMSNGITALVSITRVVTICVRFVWSLYPWTRAVVSPRASWRNSGFMGQRLQRNTSWTKCRQLPVVWRRVEKRFHNCFWNTKATAVDFDQLLEMTAVSFPKWEFAFRHPIHRTWVSCT